MTDDKSGDAIPHGPSGTTENICPVCGGTGIADDGPCRNCEGMGKLASGAGRA